MALISPTVQAQLAVELNFGDNDNAVYYQADPTTVKASPIKKSFFRTVQISRLGKTSPQGGPFLRLDGNSNFLKLPASPGLKMDGDVALTISFWIYVESSFTSGEIINSDNGLISGYRLYLDNNVPTLELREGKKEFFSSDQPLDVMRWTHVGVVCDGMRDSVRFVVDGTPVKTLPFTKVTQFHSGTTTFVGALATSETPNYLRANLDGLRIFVGEDTVFKDIVPAYDRNRNLFLDKQKDERPSAFTLWHNYPNPFNLSTTIEFELREQGDVILTIYDLLGNAVRNLHSGTLEAGIYQYSWEGADNDGRIVPSGIYFVRLSFNGLIQTKKMVLVK